MIKFLNTPDTDTTAANTANKPAVIVDNHSIMADINRLFESPVPSVPFVPAVPTDAADALIQKANEAINKSNELLSPAAAPVPTKSKRVRKTKQIQAQTKTPAAIVPPLTDAVPPEPQTAAVNAVIALKDLFSFKPLIETASINLPSYDSIPDTDTDYLFQTDVTNQILLYLFYPNHDCLWLAGEAGTGKTTAVLQVAARLRWGVQQITCSNKTESYDLIGRTTLVNGSLKFEYGALAHAMKYGEILLLNEIDTMSPQDLSTLNDVLEGKPLTVVQNNGEVIKPHPLFRVIATANTFGAGDETGLYSGTRQMNAAFLDRFRFVKVDYPTDAEMQTLINRRYSLDKSTVDNVLKVVADLRKMLAGNEDGTGFSVPVTTRTILKVCGLLDLHIDPLTAFNVSLGNRLNKDEYAFLQRLLVDVFGEAVTRQQSKAIAYAKL